MASVSIMGPHVDAYADEGAEKPALVQTHIDLHFRSAKPAKLVPARAAEGALQRLWRLGDLPTWADEGAL